MAIDLNLPFDNSTIRLVASWLGTSEAKLAEVLALKPELRYLEFSRSKGPNRPPRIINPPVDCLRRIQKMILKKLVTSIPVSPFCHGFVPGRSIITNAKVHFPQAQSLLKLDLKNAFPSVKLQRIYVGLNWGLGRILKHGQPTMAVGERREFCRLIANLCCHNGCLPQGAPTSGALLNLACRSLDRACAMLTRQWADRLPQGSFSRYADDLAFSTTAESIPEEFKKSAIKLIRRCGFRANENKIKVQKASKVDLVLCGVRLHQGLLSLPRDTMRKMRQIFHATALLEPLDVPIECRRKIIGLIGYLTMVTPCCPSTLEKSLSRLVAKHGSWIKPKQSTARPNLPGTYG